MAPSEGLGQLATPLYVRDRLVRPARAFGDLGPAQPGPPPLHLTPVHVCILSFNINPQLKHMHAVWHQQLHFQMAGFVNLQDVNLSPFKLLGRVKRGLSYSIPGRIFPFVQNE